VNPGANLLEVSRAIAGSRPCGTSGSFVQVRDAHSSSPRHQRVFPQRVKESSVVRKNHSPSVAETSEASPHSRVAGSQRLSEDFPNTRDRGR
jgi:hypothetical protein